MKTIIFHLHSTAVYHWLTCLPITVPPSPVTAYLANLTRVITRAHLLWICDSNCFFLIFRIGFPVMLESIVVATVYLMLAHVVFTWHWSFSSIFTLYHRSIWLSFCIKSSLSSTNDQQTPTTTRYKRAKMKREPVRHQILFILLI